MGESRTPFVIGNWKLNPGPDRALDLALACAAIAESAGAQVEVGIAVPFPYLPGIAGVVSDSRLLLGAQDVSAHESGAYTGEVAASMIAAWTEFTLIGHSERRLYHGERDDTVAAKVKAAIEAGLTAIVCVGESLAQREAGDAETIVRHQLATAIEGLDGLVASSLVIAYEPVWAIGTGVSAQPSDADSMGRVIRNTLAGLGPAAGSIRILYGGSVTQGNAASYLAQPEVDGALVGGASLQPESFANIVKAAAFSPG
jgi:triosephosphate isomerase